MARVATPAGWAGGLRGFDPFRTLFRLLTSVRVALLLLALVAVAALLGVIFPQAPDEVRAVPASYSAYVEFQRGRYGIFTNPIRDLGLFEVFHSYWFNGIVIVLLLAVTVCTFSRIPPIVRNARRPVQKVNDRYFERAHHRADFSASESGASGIERALRRRRYAVKETRRDGTNVYLLADRFPWAQYGTFISHLALILFLAGAIVTKLVGFATTISVPEGQTYPVFPTIHAGQMQVENLHSASETNSQGVITRYVSNLAVFRDGKQICTGTSTVNDPMHCAGYTLHQTTMSDGVSLQVRNAGTGQLVYDEVPEIGTNGGAPSPRLMVRDSAGNVLFDDTVVLTPADPSFTELYSVLPLQTKIGDTSKPLVIVVAAVQSPGNKWTVHVSQIGTQTGAEGNDMPLQAGQSVTALGYTFSLGALNAIPLSVVQGIPGMESAALLQVETAADGTQYLDLVNMGALQGGSGAGAADPAAAATPSSAYPAGPSAAAPQAGYQAGTAAAALPAASPTGTAAAPAGAPAPSAGASDAVTDPSTSQRLDLQPGQAQQLGNYTYTFVGARSISGITVRKDPGSTFIWVATALLLLGLAVTFYLPRRRMWVKITPDRVFMAGVADRIVDFSSEMRKIGAAAGSPDALACEEES